MTNREYLIQNYQKELAEIALNFDILAIVDRVPKGCRETQCDDCMFAGTWCEDQIPEWLDKKHVTYEVDWTKVPVDTPIYVKDMDCEPYKKRHFAKYENGMVYAWRSGFTSFTGERDAVHWYQAKLAEPHQEWMKEVEEDG